MIVSTVYVLFFVVVAALGNIRSKNDKRLCGVSDRNRLRCQDNDGECWAQPAQCHCRYGNNPRAYPNCPRKNTDTNKTCNGEQCSKHSSCKQSKCTCIHSNQQYPNCCKRKCTKAGYTCKNQRCIKVTIQRPPTDRVSTWNSWSAWSACSRTCGSGSQSRTRECPGNCKGGSGLEQKPCVLKSCEICPPGWRHEKSSCYFLCTEEKNWNDANGHCKSLNSNLVSIQSIEENSFLHDYVDCKRYWTGGCNVGGVWEWSDGSPFIFTHWDWLQPNDYPMSDSSLAGSWLGGSNDKWHDWKSYERAQFVCERKNQNSCQDNCVAAYDQRLPCQCNDKCSHYGNCCPDYYDFCHITNHRTPPPPGPPPTPLPRPPPSPTPIDCQWCNWSAWQESKGEGCSLEEKRTRTPGCVLASGGGKECVGATQETKNYREVITQTGPMVNRDFHNHGDLESMKFDIECPGGCIQIHKTMMACQEQKISQSDARSRDERKAKEFCRNKERCSFTPGPSFFGQRGNGKCEVWFTYGCNNNGGQIIDRNSKESGVHTPNVGKNVGRGGLGINLFGLKLFFG